MKKDQNRTRINLRAYPRKAISGHIEYICDERQKRSPANWYNISRGGMYFVSDEQIPLGKTLLIAILEKGSNSPDSTTPSFQGEVVRCEGTKENPLTFGVGIKFFMETCDRCGSKVSSADIHRTKDLLYLCPTCNSELKQTKSPIQTLIEERLLGNVL